ncbi:MAG: GAF domain-containing sensor histidine kinase [Candidatus Omnitrophica bacterium]|nr:GAF domain-containing sensor histidine kinase [Candidatus Omnitrophota bacterium]MDD5653598.1 GAF domain-containing sensor histidine kinase [Candidatus Omnitrophota bacterium]
MLEIIVVVTSVLVALALAIVVANKMEAIRRRDTEITSLKKSLDEMDEQAKLIVRTDMELNKTQEALDKKVGGLYALQKIAKTMSTTLEENQIFKVLNAEHLKELGFEKACLFLWNAAERKFVPCLSIGYFADEITQIESDLTSKNQKYLDLIQNNRATSSFSLSDHFLTKSELLQTYKVNSFIIAPIVPKEGNKGFLVAGTENVDTAITEGDEELITIFANQISQSLENARLFEKTWRAQQGLEQKVEERTRELRMALEEVKLVSRRKTDFISAVSHELRTPLTSIKGYASILLTGKLGDLPEEIHARLEKINRHSDELAHLVNDLLDIARIESGKMVMKKEEQDLNKIVDQVGDLLSVQFKDRKINFIVDIASDAHIISADYSQINRVFINIIGNALKFTPPNGKITVSSRKKDGQVQIDISDTGCGIPEEARQAIFDEFYRVDNTINQELKGTGLGLSLVKHIVEAHGGKIWVTSKIGEGSTFSFSLP